MRTHKYINKAKCTACLLVFFACLLCSFPALAVNPDEILAESAVLLDAETGQVLFEKNGSQLMHPASITKVMTGLLVAENADFSSTVTVSEEALQIPWGTSHIALQAGEQISVDDAMYALMLHSANDAANALAEHVAGSQQQFVQMMNQRAKELGAEQTNFVNAHGLSDDNHKTTAYDMALITKEAVGNQVFMQYFGAQRHTIQPTNKQKDIREFPNYQYMLLPNQWVYNPDVIGGKVGYTDEARHTMTTAAEKNGRTLVCVVMGDGYEGRFDDTQALLDFGFEEFSKVAILWPDQLPTGKILPIVDSGNAIGYERLVLPQESSVLLHNSARLEQIQYTAVLPDQIQKGEEASSAYISLILSEAPGESIPSMLLNIPYSTEGFSAAAQIIASPIIGEAKPKPKLEIPPLVFEVLKICGIIAATVMIFLIWAHFNRMRLRKKRMKQRKIQMYRQTSRYRSRIS